MDWMQLVCKWPTLFMSRAFEVETWRRGQGKVQTLMDSSSLTSVEGAWIKPPDTKAIQIEPRAFKDQN